MTDQLLDARGLKCPLPVLKARKRLQGMRAGDVLTVLADDPVAPLDLQHLAQEDGYALLEMRQDGAHTVARLQKGGA
jgi:tRNA 2-thiouridine synthesizing protein A